MFVLASDCEIINLIKHTSPLDLVFIQHGRLAMLVIIPDIAPPIAVIAPTIASPIAVIIPDKDLTTFIISPLGIVIHSKM